MPVSGAAKPSAQTLGNLPDDAIEIMRTRKLSLLKTTRILFALLKYNLEKEGFSLTGQQTGKGALELCRQVRPDLILLDIMLPDSDGLDICKGIRQRSRPGRGSDHFPDRARLRDRSHRRPGTGRQRLRGQAVFRARTDRAHQAAVPQPDLAAACAGSGRTGTRPSSRQVKLNGVPLR
jgi:CheY-like chemotaxis protein